MRVLIAANTFYPNFFGGAETYTLDLAVELQRQGHDVLIVCSESWDKPTGVGSPILIQRTEYRGLSVLRMYWDSRNTPESLIFTGYPAHESHFDRIAEEFRPDILHIINMTRQMAWTRIAARRRIPLVLTAVDFGFTCVKHHLLHDWDHRCDGRNGQLKCTHCVAGWKGIPRTPSFDTRWKALRRMPEGFRTRLWSSLKTLSRDKVGGYARRYDYECWRHMHAVLAFWKGLHQQARWTFAPCEFLRQTLVQNGFPSDRVETLVYGLDESRFDANPTAKSPRTGKVRFAYIGRHNQIKGLDVLLRAVELLKDREDFSLTVYGELEIWNRWQSYIEDMLAKASDADPRVVLGGRLNHGQITAAYRDIDFLIVPSRWYENSPVSILEALHHRTPVIASDVEGISYLITHGKNGLLFPVGMPEALSLEMRRVLDDAALAGRLREGIAPPMGIREHTERVVDRYRRVIGGVPA